MAQIYKNSEGKYYKLSENHPVLSFIYLLLFVLLGTVVFSLLAMGIGMAVYGTSILQEMPAILAGEVPSKINFIKLFQMLSSIGTFIIPFYLLTILESKKTQYADFSMPNPKRLLVLAMAIMLFSIPLLEISIIVNLKMQLPEFLSNLEIWMKEKESQMEKLTYMLISTTQYSDLAINIVMMAVLPAIGEELIFRGALQNIVWRWLKNPHIAIWVVAIIFSAIHVQFYGFLPRMLMGALFGYLYYWGKSIWLPILAHFVNNAYVTIYVFILLKQGKTIEEVNETSPSHWVIYLISIIVTTIIIHYFWKVFKEKQKTIETEKTYGTELE